VTSARTIFYHFPNSYATGNNSIYHSSAKTARLHSFFHSENYISM